MISKHIWPFVCEILASLGDALGRGHTIFTSRELMWCYACSWDVRGDWTLNSMTQIHTYVTPLTSRDLTWRKRSDRSVNLRHRIQCSIASHIPTARVTSHELTWREGSVSLPLEEYARSAAWRPSSGWGRFMAATISRQFLTAEDLVRAPVSPYRFMAKRHLEGLFSEYFHFSLSVSFYQPIWAAARYKPWVCGRPLAGIAGSNPADGMDACLLWVLCVCQVEVSAPG